MPKNIVMRSFGSDNHGVHPAVLEAIQQTNIILVKFLPSIIDKLLIHHFFMYGIRNLTKYVWLFHGIQQRKMLRSLLIRLRI